ncbi:MAG: hypothetical protein JXA09_08590 [Anaerolineae bacterium]|nr:hypothetical protein [Anaerolineae bacterium]
MRSYRSAMIVTLVLALVLAWRPADACAQAAGRPILTIRRYSVTPSPVKAGQEFTVEIEVYNNGSRAGENTVAIWSGGDFLPVGENGHLLWQLHINHSVVVQQRMRAPATLGSGVHALRVDLAANDYEGNHYEYPHTVPVEVVAASSGRPSGPPKVVVARAQTEPAVLSPGLPFTLTLGLTNLGAGAASGVYLGCGSDGLAIPVEGSDLVAVGAIRAGGAVTVAVPLVLAWDVAGSGRQAMAVSLEYADSGGGRYEDRQAIGVDVDPRLAPQPTLIVESYATDPATLAPGDPFTLTVRVANVGSGAAGRVSLAFGGQDGTRAGPFTLLQAGHVAFVGDIAPGSAVSLSRQLLVAARAEAKPYGLPLAVSYEDQHGARGELVQLLSLIVAERPTRAPQLLITSYATTPDFVTAGDALDLTVQIANVGTADAQRVVLALGGADGGALEPLMPVGSGNVVFVDRLAQGESVQVERRLIVDGAAQAKAYNIPVALSYAGPDGAAQSDVQRLSLIVRRRIELLVGVYSRPQALVAGAPAPFSFEVLNVGRGVVDIVGLRATGLDTTIEADGTPFVGPLDPGGSAPLDLTLTPRREGTIQVTVHVEYRDDLYQVQRTSQTLEFAVDAAPAATGNPPAAPDVSHTASLWQAIARAVRGFLGFGS